jgi:hypothetical protein
MYRKDAMQTPAVKKNTGEFIVTTDSVWTIAVNVFTSPREAFAAIREKPRFWFPLLLVLAMSGAAAAIYMMGVDLAWFYEEQLSNSAPNLSDAEIEQATTFVAQAPKALIAGAATLSTTIFLSIIYLLSALYYRIVSGFTKDGIRYAQWFGLVCWCALPAVLTQIATIVNLSTSDVTMMPQTEVNPLAIPSLLGMDVGGNTPLARIATYLDPTTIWTAVLTIFGYRAWTGKSILVSTLIVITPLVLIYGLLAAL